MMGDFNSTWMAVTMTWEAATNGLENGSIAVTDNSSNAIAGLENESVAGPSLENGSVAVPSLTAIASQLTAYKVAIATHVYVLPVIVFLGLVGNTLSLLIMLKPHNRRISCCNYLAGLSVSDNLMLLNALNYWTISFKDRPATNTECNIMAWLFQAVSFTSIVLIFSMTVDRFLAIRFPFKARRLCTPHRARVAIACIAVVVPLYTLPYFFTSRLFPGRTCVAVATSNPLAAAYNWVNIFLGSIVPFIGLLTMNTFIILTVRRRQDLSGSTGSAKQEPKDTRDKHMDENESSNGKKDMVEGSVNPSNENDASFNGNLKAVNDASTKDNPKKTTNDVSTKDNLKEANDDASTKTNQKVTDNASTKDPKEATDDASTNDSQEDTKYASTKNNVKTTESTTEPTANKSTKDRAYATTKNSLKLKSPPSVKKQSNETQLTAMLLLVTFTFLTLTLPQYARYLVAVLWNYTSRAEDYADFLLLAHVSNRFYYANSACNFFLYCISGNRFRQDVKALFVK